MKKSKRNYQIAKAAKKRIMIDNIVVDYVENNLSVNEIAKKYRKNIQFVYRVLHQRNVEIVRGMTYLYEDMAADYISGMDAEQIADKYSVCEATIYRALKMNNVPKRYRQQEATEKQIAIANRVINGESQSVIARELGISRQRVHQIYKEYMERNNG